MAPRTAPTREPPARRSTPMPTPAELDEGRRNRGGGREVTLADLESGLPIDEHALEVAVREQPDLYYRVAKLLALETSRRDAMAQALKEEEARADDHIRAQAEKLEEKITETAIKSQVQLDTKVQEIRDGLTAINKRVAELAALERTYSQRMSALRLLVELYVSNYYSTAAENGGMKARTADADRARRAAADARRDPRR